MCKKTSILLSSLLVLTSPFAFAETEKEASKDTTNVVLGVLLTYGLASMLWGQSIDKAEKEKAIAAKKAQQERSSATSNTLNEAATVGLGILGIGSISLLHGLATAPKLPEPVRRCSDKCQSNYNNVIAICQGYIGDKKSACERKADAGRSSCRRSCD